PALFSTRRWRETAGRLMGSASASSRTERARAPSSSTMARRRGSPRASKGSPLGWDGAGSAATIGNTKVTDGGGGPQGASRLTSPPSPRFHVPRAPDSHEAGDRRAHRHRHLALDV